MSGTVPILAYRPSPASERPLPSLGAPYRVRVESSFQAALHAVVTDRPRVVIVDAQGDAAYGARFVQALRSLDLPFDLHFVMLSSRCDAVTLAHGVRVGADVMLCPPLRSEELTRAVNRLAGHCHSCART